MWEYGSSDGSDTWFSDSATTIHISPNQEDFSSYQKYDQECSIKAFEKNSVKGIGKGNIAVNIKCSRKTMRICLSQVMHIPEAKGKVLSLKILAPKGFQSHILADHICISKDIITYSKTLLGKDLY